MTKGKPRDDKQQIFAMAREGIPPAEIARRLGTISAKHVAVVLCEARRAGEAIPYFRSTTDQRMNGRTRKELRYFRAAAQRRGITVPALLDRLDARIAADNLVDAILDDAP